MPQEFDVVCLGGGGAGGEFVLAIKLATPLETLADVIHPFPAFNRVLGRSLQELAVKLALESAARS